ncbi:MAG: hypothetical protein AAFP20_00840 [Cyanobacteria bacterium J06614_10]
MPFSLPVDNLTKLPLAPITESHALSAQPDNRLGVTRLPSLSRNTPSNLLVSANTQQVAKAVFKKDNPYVTLHDELGPIFDDTDFTELFSKVGQSDIPSVAAGLGHPHAIPQIA